MIPNDDELRVMMRLTAETIGMPLSDERIEIDLPSFRTYLQSLQILLDYPVPIETEAAHVFRLARGQER